MSSGIVEITELKLKPGATDEQFLSTVADVNSEVTKLRGFRARRLLKSEGSWIEVMEWDDMDCAREAGEKWGNLPGVQTYCAMVNYETVKVSYHPLMATSSA